jgi:hypothetical protein
VPALRRSCAQAPCKKGNSFVALKGRVTPPPWLAVNERKNTYDKEISPQPHPPPLLGGGTIRDVLFIPSESGLVRARCVFSFDNPLPASTRVHISLL